MLLIKSPERRQRFFFVSLNRFHALFGVSVVGFEQVNDGLERSSENKIRKTLKRQSG